MKKRTGIAVCLAALALLVVPDGSSLFAQGQGRGGRGGRGAPAPDPTRPHQFELIEGTTARYKVREQLAGISFPSDAVGTTESVTGRIIINPDGSIDAGSRITVDLRTLATDQSMRDGYVRRNTLDTEQFPTLDLVPKRTVGLPSPVPAGNQAQVGFELVTDMTVRGVTREVTWNVVAVLGNESAGGRATTTLDFATFELPKPSLARLLSVDDEIQLEIEFRCRRTVL